jgi:Uncharacterized conserved protein
MNMISERERAFENKFAHDEELKFKAQVLRNRLAATWAAPLAGKTDVDAYVVEVIDAALKAGGDVFDKLKSDLDAAGAAVSADDLRAKLDQLLGTAIEQVSSK